MTGGTVTVFGGTGFLGRRIVDRLVAADKAVRIAVRHPGQSARAGPAPATIAPLFADIVSGEGVAAALAGAYAAVNAVSLYVERGAHTFRAVHVDAAGRLADSAAAAGVARLVHVSGIGADASSPSPYIGSRGAGERAVRAAFAAAVIVRPAVMFGPDDALISTLAGLLTRLPAFPLFAGGETRLQPVHVDDVASAIVRALDADAAPVYELGGPRIYAYHELVRLIAGRLGVSPLLLPVPFLAWRTLARVAELLPTAPLTRGQVALMEVDTVAGATLPGLASLGITPQSLESALDAILAAARPGRPPS
jgi:NADH dehydrogenase